MEADQRVELVFVPSPTIGHVVSTVEVAKLLLRHDHRLSITVIILKVPLDSKITPYTDSLSAADRINFVTVPLCNPDDDESIPKARALFSLIEKKKDLVRDAVDEIVTKFGSAPNSPRFAGLVIDMFCTSMIDVANQFGVPSYMFYTSGAAFLTFHFYIQELFEEKNGDLTEAFNHPDDLLIDMPLFRHPYPAKLLPSVFLVPEWLQNFVKLTKRFRELKGMMVNTFQELESHAIEFLNSDPEIPPVYPLGPVLNIHGGVDSIKEKEDDVIWWLDEQPAMSVVFLCFGSMGSFNMEQVKEISTALERTGHRFLWSLRKPPPKGEFAPTEYEKVEEALPEGFLTRTAGIGKVIGWAPQVAILRHPAVGGFVSHCGWNSTLESLWFGVPVAAWPMYAEQQFNAFQMVVELGLGVEVRMEYRKDQMTGESNGVVTAAEIEIAIGRLMEKESEVRKRVKEMSEVSRKALTAEGGSSRTHLARFVGDVMANMPPPPPPPLQN